MFILNYNTWRIYASVANIHIINRNSQDYVYVKGEYQSTMQKIKHYLKHENKIKENKVRDPNQRWHSPNSTPGHYFSLFKTLKNAVQYFVKYRHVVLRIYMLTGRNSNDKIRKSNNYVDG